MGDMIDREATALAVANVEIGYHDGISGDWHPKSGPAIISAACAAIRALPAASAEDVRAEALTVAQAAQVLNQKWPYHILEPAFDAMQAVEGEGVDTMFAAGIRALALIAHNTTEG